MVLYFMYSKVVGFIFLQNNHKHLSFFVYFIFYTKFYYGKSFLCLTEFCEENFKNKDILYSVYKQKKFNFRFLRKFQKQNSISILNLI